MSEELKTIDVRQFKRLSFPYLYYNEGGEVELRLIVLALMKGAGKNE